MAGTKRGTDYSKICETCGNPFWRHYTETRWQFSRRLTCSKACRKRPYAVRFWRRVDRTTTPEGCWPWTGGKFRDSGYGAFWVEDQNVGAHRMAYILTHGAVPDGKYILHTCDNRACCNPAHLYAGTPQDNMDDRSIRGRVNPARGSRRSQHLKEDDIPVIVARYLAGETAAAVGRDYGVTQTAVALILRGRTWPHVPRKTYKSNRYHRTEVGELK